MSIPAKIYEPNLKPNNEFDASSQDPEESVSSETSSSYESQECIVLNDDDKSRIQKTVIVSGTNAGLFRKSEIVADKNYESAEEQPIEDEPFPSVFVKYRGENICDTQDQPIEEVKNELIEEEFFDQDIEKSSDSSENVQAFDSKSLPNSDKTLLTEEKVQIFVESPKKIEAVQVSEPKPHSESHKKTDDFLVSQVSNKNDEKVIRNSLTEIVRSESVSKKSKGGSKKSGESCGKCSIF